MLTPTKIRTRWLTQDRVITAIVVLLSVIAWGWNCRVSLTGEGNLTSTYVHEYVIRWPIISVPIIFLLGAWGDFRQWLKNHPLGLAYLCIVVGHIFWPLPK